MATGAPNLTGPIRINVAGELLSLGYALLGKLGEGASSGVFDARRLEDGRRVAVKVSRTDIPEAALVVARMQTEWNVGRGLRHPHLVGVYDGGVLSDGRAFLVMERLHGHDLLEELESKGALLPVRALQIARQTCEALQVLHRRGAVHRDVKPENVFLCADGRLPDHVKLIDLGILALPDDDPERAHEATGQFIMGTPLYLAPEQATGARPDARTDLYALGGVLYHMLAGRPPFEGDDPTEIVSRHLNAKADSLGGLLPDLPESIVKLVHHCLEKDREDRPATAQEVITAIDLCIERLAVVIEPAPSRRSAPLPELPLPGAASDWLRYSELVQRYVAAYFPGESAPPALRVSVFEVGDARQSYLKAQAAADANRERADLAARDRILQRELHQRRAHHVSAALERARLRVKEASRVADENAATLDAADDAYDNELALLRALTGGEVGDANLRALAARHQSLEVVVLQRTARTAGLDAARALELAAAEQLAALRGEELDVQRALSEGDLDEQDDGYRNEQAAARAVDHAISALRLVEQSCVRLLLEYVRFLTLPGR